MHCVEMYLDMSFVLLLLLLSPQADGRVMSDKTCKAVGKDNTFQYRWGWLEVDPLCSLGST
jgi:hypothetical protein